MKYGGSATLCAPGTRGSTVEGENDPMRYRRRWRQPHTHAHTHTKVISFGTRASWEWPRLYVAKSMLVSRCLFVRRWNDTVDTPPFEPANLRCRRDIILLGDTRASRCGRSKGLFRASSICNIFLDRAYIKASDRDRSHDRETSLNTQFVRTRTRGFEFRLPDNMMIAAWYRGFDNYNQQ